jgi:hypothetical protein
MHCFRVKNSSIVLHRPCNAILPARAKSRAYLEALEQALDTIPGITSPQEMGEILGKVIHPGPVTGQRMQLFLTLRDRQAVS